MLFSPISPISRLCPNLFFLKSSPRDDFATLSQPLFHRFRDSVPTSFSPISRLCPNLFLCFFMFFSPISRLCPNLFLCCGNSLGSGLKKKGCRFTHSNLLPNNIYIIFLYFLLPYFLFLILNISAFRFMFSFEFFRDMN